MIDSDIRICPAHLKIVVGVSPTAEILAIG